MYSLKAVCAVAVAGKMLPRNSVLKVPDDITEAQAKNLLARGKVEVATADDADKAADTAPAPTTALAPGAITTTTAPAVVATANPPAAKKAAAAKK